MYDPTGSSGPSDPPRPTRSLAERYGPVATWHGLTPINPETGHASLSLRADDGTIHRFRLTAEELTAVAEVATAAVAAQAVRVNVHSPSSSGSPARSVSMPLDGVAV